MPISGGHIWKKKREFVIFLEGLSFTNPRLSSCYPQLCLNSTLVHLKGSLLL